MESGRLTRPRLKGVTHPRGSTPKIRKERPPAVVGRVPAAYVKMMVMPVVPATIIVRFIIGQTQTIAGVSGEPPLRAQIIYGADHQRPHLSINSHHPHIVTVMQFADEEGGSPDIKSVHSTAAMKLVHPIQLKLPQQYLSPVK